MKAYWGAENRVGKSGCEICKIWGSSWTRWASHQVDLGGKHVGEGHVNPTDIRRKTIDLKLWPNQSKLYCAHLRAKSVTVSHEQPRTSFLSLFYRAKPQGEGFYRKCGYRSKTRKLKKSSWNICYRPFCIHKGGAPPNTKKQKRKFYSK